MYHTASRAWCQAVGPRVDRGVRPRSRRATCALGGGQGALLLPRQVGASAMHRYALLCWTGEADEVLKECLNDYGHRQQQQAEDKTKGSGWQREPFFGSG
jgi:hypothetical protein